MKLIKTLAMVGSTAAVALGVMAVPAHAAGDCNSDTVCMWEDNDYTGSKYVDQYGNDGRYQIDWWDGDNEISSVVNNTGKCVRLYDNDSWGGASYLIEPYGTRYRLKLNGYDNKAESYEIYDC